MGTNFAPLLADIFLYSYEAEFIQSLFSTGRKRLASHFNFTYIYTSMTYCPLLTLTLKIISVICIPLNLRSNTRRRATLRLPTWIYSCQSVGTVNFTLPFTTSVTIIISILQTFRSWAATSHLRPPMAFLSHNSSATLGLAPLMNVLVWGLCVFSISFSGRVCKGTFEIVSKEVLWSVRGYYQTIWGCPLPNVTRHSGWWPSTVTHSIDQALHQFLTLLLIWT